MLIVMGIMELEEFAKFYHPGPNENPQQVSEIVSSLYIGLSRMGLMRDLNQEQARVILGACEDFRDAGYSRGLSRGVVGMMPSISR